MNGLVLKSTGSWYKVKLDDSGEMVEARIRGKFRMQGMKFTNPVTVGDHVVMSKDKEDSYRIDEIGDRKNFIVRKSVNLSKQFHVLASNVDQALLIVSLKEPRTYTEFIDRFLVTATAYEIPTIIVFNKVDLLDGLYLEELEDLEAIYASAGYQTLRTSAETGEGVDALSELIKDKVTVLSGHSGVGKSTLVNRIDPDLDLKMGELSEAHASGLHTTTFAEMHEINIGGYLIDTPGIKGWGIVNIEKNELARYFPEMLKVSSDCHYGNCVHVNEPKCAVKNAVEAGLISESRYDNYLNLYLEDEDESYR